jgi:transposase
MKLPNPLPASMLQIPVSALWECIASISTELESQKADLSEARKQIVRLEAQVQELEESQLEVEALASENAKLKERLNQPVKTSENSSIPPSSQVKASTLPRQRASTPRARVGKSRCRQMPDRQVACEAEPCQQCGADLQHSRRREIGRQQVVELPPQRALVVELVRYRRTCACGHCQDDHYPAGYDAPHQVFGPRLHALITYFNGTHHIAQDRLQHLLLDVFGVEMSAGALQNSLSYTAQQLEAPAEAILETVRQSEVVGSDETGLRSEGKNGWLWVLQTAQVSYFAAARRRSGQVLKTLLGEAKIPVWVSDLYAGQLTANAEQFAVCNAHQLRNLQFSVDAGDTLFAAPMQALLRDGLKLTRQRDTLSAEAYQAQSHRIKTAALALIDTPTDHKVAKRLQKRFRKHFDKIWLFLDDPRAPFENNASERALRPAVIHRKVIGAFRSSKGAENYALYRTIEDTARKQGRNIFDVLFDALGKPLSLPMVFASLDST